MKISASIILVYALFVLVGGMIGYNQAHSIASLIAGSLFSVALIACSYGILKNSYLSFAISLGLVSFLALFFTYRFIVTAKFMPAGMMIVLSLITLFLAYNYRKQALPISKK